MILFIAFSGVYILFLSWCRWHWVRTPSSVQTSELLEFSVLVPVRNEQKNIGHLLQSLLQQDYPREKFEVIVVDDQSEDETIHLVDQFIQKNQLTWTVLHVGKEEQGGKKKAITYGVQQAKYAYVITTDGDCTVNTGWLKSYTDRYAQSGAVMISGPVKMNSDNWFTRLQSMEFSCLIGIGAATLHSGNPTMCNGANLSYKKEVFEEVGGYMGNDSIPSGDDEFLLQKVVKKYPGRVCFSKSMDAIAYTKAKATIGELLNQRIRWSSKWRFHKSLFIKLMALLVFINYLVMFLAVAEVVVSERYWVLLGVMGLRWMFLSFFSYPLGRFFKVSGVLWLSLLIEIIYPFFVVFLGIASIFGKYSWKGRYYS